MVRPLTKQLLLIWVLHFMVLGLNDGLGFGFRAEADDGSGWGSGRHSRV